jgi:hypothetical protein
VRSIYTARWWSPWNVWISCSENSFGGPKYLIRFTVVDMAVRIPTSKNFVSVLKPGSEADFHEEQCSTGPEREIADLTSMTARNQRRTVTLSP